jgi:hypothetical protein
MSLRVKQRIEPDGRFFPCVSRLRFVRQEFFGFNMLYRAHRPTPEAAKLASEFPELRACSDERRNHNASQKRCVARGPNLRRGFFRFNGLYRTHRPTTKIRVLRRANPCRDAVQRMNYEP